MEESRQVMKKIKKAISIISGVIIAFMIAITALWFVGRYILKIRPVDNVTTKEKLITYFTDNYGVFDKVVKDIIENDYPAEIYGDWVSRSEDVKYNIYYKNTQSEDIISLFSNKEWYIDNVIITKNSEIADECIIFMQCNAVNGYNYWGIYYTPSDDLVGWDGLKRFKPTEPEGEGYYIEAYGCQYYTEKICDNWWYFWAFY